MAGQHDKNAIGVGSGLGIGRFNRSSSSALARVTGGAMALAGVGILTGYV